MRTTDQMTEEQLKKYERFMDFYSDDMIKAYSQVFKKHRESVEDKEYYQAYLNIVKKTARVIKELGIEDPLCASIIFQYLLWKGYLSKDKNLVYSISDRMNNIAITGADIMRGRSVCLNNADMHASVLREMGIEAYLLGCNVDTKTPANFEYKPDIKRQIEEKVKLSDKLLGKIVGATPLRNIGNHAVTLFKFESVYFISDPTSLAFANFSDFLKARYVGSALEMDIKPWLLLMLGKVPEEDFRTIIRETYVRSDKQLLTVPVVKSLYEGSIDLCKKNHFLLDDFHDDNITDIDIICKTLKPVKPKDIKKA